MTPAEFFHDSAPFITAFNAWAERFRDVAIADHLCYKCERTEEFEELRAMLEHHARFLYQSIIAGRRIALVGLVSSISTVLGDIALLELSDQKPDGSQASGFDHIEICPKTGSMNDLVGHIEKAGITFTKITRPHHTTFDALLVDNFKIRLEDEALLQKIIREEMK